MKCTGNVTENIHATLLHWPDGPEYAERPPPNRLLTVADAAINPDYGERYVAKTLSRLFDLKQTLLTARD